MLGLSALTLAGCPIGDPAPDIDLFQAIVENRTAHDELRVEFIYGSEVNGEEFLTAEQPSQSLGTRCVKQLAASALNGETYELERLCPGDAWYIGERVLRAPTRSRILDWCDEADRAERPPIEVWERFAEHGFTNRHIFKAFLEGHHDPTHYDELVSAAGSRENEICGIARDDDRWSAATD